MSEHNSMGFFGVKKDIHIPGNNVFLDFNQ